MNKVWEINDDTLKRYEQLEQSVAELRSEIAYLKGFIQGRDAIILEAAELLRSAGESISYTDNAANAWKWYDKRDEWMKEHLPLSTPHNWVHP